LAYTNSGKVAGIRPFSPDSGDLCRNPAQNGWIPAVLASFRPEQLDPAKCRGSDRSGQIQAGSVQDLGQMADDPAIWPEFGMVSSESGDICWTSLDSGLICRIPALTGVGI
jgi:hypothetical protein